MKLNIEIIQGSFEDVLRRLDAQVWPRIDGFVDAKINPFADINVERIDLGVNVDDDIPDDKFNETVGALEQKITHAAETLAQLPAIYTIRQLKRGLVREINVPAGCDPMSPDEIGSAVKRAARTLEGKLTLFFGSGAQDSFFAALDCSTPPAILGHPVVFQHDVELLDPLVVEELFPAPAGDDGTTTVPAPTPLEYRTKLLEAARRSPWFILPGCRKGADKPFEYVVKTRPHIVGPQLAIEWQTNLFPRADVGDRVVTVAPSKLVLAKVIK